MNYYKSLLLLSTITVVCCVASCKKDNVEKIDKQDECIISLNLPLQTVEINDEPLTKATSDQTDAYFVSLSEYNSNTETYTSYAKGSFQMGKDMQITIHSGSKYNIQAAYFTNFIGTSYLWDYLYSGSYGYGGDNQFHYGESANLMSWCNTITLGKSFYAELKDYTPTNSISMELQPTYSGLKMSVEGEVKTGRVVCKLGDWTNEKNISIDLSKSSSAETYISTPSLMSSSKQAAIAAVIRYIDESNIETVLFSDSFTFSTGKRKVVKVNLSSSGNTNSEISMGLTTKDEELTDEDVLNINGTLK